MRNIRWFDVVAVLSLMGCTAVLSISVILGWQTGADVRNTASEQRERILHLEAESLKRDMLILEEITKNREAFLEFKALMSKKK